MRYLLSFFIVLIFGSTAFGQAKNDPGSPAPPFFQVTSLDGKTFNSPDLKGKIVVLNLWFINCPHCIEEIKLLNKVVDDYSGGSDIVYIGMATNNKTDLEKFLKKNPFKYNIVANAGDTMLFSFGDKQKDGSYFLPFPTHVVIDRSGKVITKTSGIKGVEAVRNELARQLSKSST